MRIRMIWRTAAAPALFLLMGATSAPATQAGWKELGPGHLLCSEPAGRYANYQIPPLQPGKPVTFRFKFVSENFDPKWTANAALIFHGAAGSMRIEVGEARNDRGHIYLVLGGIHPGTNVGEMLDRIPVTAFNDWINVETELDSKGVVRVFSRNAKGLLKLGAGGPVNTELHCNSGVFEIEMVPPPAS